MPLGEWFQCLSEQVRSLVPIFGHLLHRPLDNCVQLGWYVGSNSVEAACGLRERLGGNGLAYEPVSPLGLATLVGDDPQQVQCFGLLRLVIEDTPVQDFSVLKAIGLMMQLGLGQERCCTRLWLAVPMLWLASCAPFAGCFPAHGSLYPTCFSLTAAFLHIVRSLGWRAEPILADRHYGENTHCALVVWVGGTPHLLDPGYLIVRPIALERQEETRVLTSFNEVILSPRDGGDRIELHTLQHGHRSHRLTFKAAPADPAEFLKAWDASFSWDMMRYPVLTRVVAGNHVYLQGRLLQVRGRENFERDEVALEELPRRVAREFGLDVGIVERALQILVRQGEMHGGAPAS